MKKLFLLMFANIAVVFALEIPGFFCEMTKTEGVTYKQVEEKFKFFTNKVNEYYKLFKHKKRSEPDYLKVRLEYEKVCKEYKKYQKMHQCIQPDLLAMKIDLKKGDLTTGQQVIKLYKFLKSQNQNDKIEALAQAIKKNRLDDFKYINARFGMIFALDLLKEDGELRLDIFFIDRKNNIRNIKFSGDANLFPQNKRIKLSNFDELQTKSGQHLNLSIQAKSALAYILEGKLLGFENTTPLKTYMKENKLKVYAPEGIENQIGLILAVSPLPGRKIDEVNFYLREGEKKIAIRRRFKDKFYIEDCPAPCRIDFPLLDEIKISQKRNSSKNMKLISGSKTPSSAKSNSEEDDFGFAYDSDEAPEVDSEYFGADYSTPKKPKSKSKPEAEEDDFGFNFGDESEQETAEKKNCKISCSKSTMTYSLKECQDKIKEWIQDGVVDSSCKCLCR